MLTDFQVVPGIINAQDFNRVFRTCKLWEWRETDKLLWYEQQLLIMTQTPQTPFNGMKTLLRQPSAVSMASSAYPVSPSNLFSSHDMVRVTSYLLTITTLAEMCLQPPMSPLSIDDAFGPSSSATPRGHLPGAGSSPIKGGNDLGSPTTEDPFDFKATVGNLSLSLW
jgi:hypothetical protein